MKQITKDQMIRSIATDYNLDPYTKIVQTFKSFPIVNGKKRISASFDSIIMGKDDIEHPYMLDQHKRNEEKLIDFKYIYRIVLKSSLKSIADEAGIQLKSSKCKVCEGGGWYSHGTRYEYKDTYCEE